MKLKLITQLLIISFLFNFHDLKGQRIDAFSTRSFDTLNVSLISKTSEDVFISACIITINGLPYDQTSILFNALGLFRDNNFTDSSKTCYINAGINETFRLRRDVPFKILSLLVSDTIKHLSLGSQPDQYYIEVGGLDYTGLVFDCEEILSPIGVLSISNSECIECNVGGGNISLGSVSSSGGTLQFSTDNGITWASNLPLYNQTGPAQTILASALSTNGCRSIIVNVGQTTPGVCNDAPSAPTGNLSILNSTCSNCSVSGGSISLGTLTGSGGSLEFSVDNGGTWNTSLPLYNQTGPAQTILASIVGTSGCRSTFTNVGSTSPGVCVIPASPIGTLNITNSFCDDCEVVGGSIALGTVSGLGGEVQYSVNGSDWAPILPIYAQSGPEQTIFASVSAQNGCRSQSMQVGQTSPGICSPVNAVVSGRINYCVDETLSISASSGESYEWTGPNNFSSSSQTLTIPNLQLVNSGEYFVTITGSNGCSDESSLQVSVDSCFNSNISCFGQINLSIDQSCSVNILPSTISPTRSPRLKLRIDLKDLNLTDDSSLSGGTLTNAVYIGDFISIDFSDADWTRFHAEGMAGPFKVSVINEQGVSCWGTVMIEDKLPPVLTVPDDVTVSCLYGPFNAYGNPRPVPGSLPDTASAAGSCSKVNIYYVDKTTDLACDGRNSVVKEILRIWTAINVKGISTVDTQYIAVEALSTDSLDGPTKLVTIPCEFKDKTAPKDLLGKPYANVEGYVGYADLYPYLIEDGDTSFLNKESVCNVGAIYVDLPPVPACQDDTDKVMCKASEKILRTWTVFDWCTGRAVEFTQVIKFMDNEAPEVTIDEPSKSYSVDAWECSTDIVLPNITVKDNCDEHASVLTITTDAPVQLRYNTSLKKWIAYDVPKGPHTFWVTSSDCCDNTVIDSINVVVVDKVAPVATTKEYIVVSLTRSGLDEGEKAVAKIKPEHIDNGSYDNCGPVYLEIRREEGPSCLNEGVDGYNNNRTYNGTVNGIDQRVSLHGPFDNVKDDDKGQFVKFCCADAADPNKLHKVWLRVWDDANMNGIFGDTLTISGVLVADNYNETWANVKVEDNTVPFLVVEEEDITVYCDEDTAKLNFNLVKGLTGLSMAQQWSAAKPVTGKVPASWLPWIDAACDYELRYADDGSLGICNTGIFSRYYYVRGGKDGAVIVRSTVQTIEIVARYENTYHEVPVPLHTVTSNTFCDEELTEEYVLANTRAALKSDNTPYKVFYKETQEDGSIYNTPNLGLNCYSYNDLFRTSFKEDTAGSFEVNWIDSGCYVFGRKIIIDEYTVGDGCKKWIVRFEYINWCEPNWNYCFSTIFKYEDTIAPTVTCGREDKDVEDATCLVDVPYGIKASDAGGCTVGLTVSAKLYLGNDLVQTKPISKVVNGSYTFNFTKLSPGLYTVKVVVRDGCGNFSECEGIIGVWPKDPTPYCIPLSTAVMKNGKVELWANDFDNGSFTNCGSALVVTTFDNEYPVASKIFEKHFFKGEGQTATPAEYEAGNAQQWRPEVETTTWPNGDIKKVLLKGSTSGKIFGCAVGDLIGTNEVIVTVWDTRYADFSVSDFCKTSLVLSNSQGDEACNGSGSANVTGRVATSVGEGVSGVEAQLSASLPEFPIMAVSAEGSFAFNNVPAGVEYEVSAKKDVDYKNGVNTLDLLRIQRHILSMTKLDNAYKFVAADANNDQKIDVNDLVDLRKLVLGVINDLPRNQSWRFVDATQKFADISNPWPLSEVVEAKAGEAANFVAVKVGDIDINAAVSATSSTTTRSGDAVTFYINERSVKAGEVVEIAVTADNFNEVFGYQFTTELNGLTVEAVESGAITVDESMYANLGGKFTMSWTNVNGASVSNDQVLFTLKVKANASTKLSQAIAMTSSVTAAEAYVGSDFATTDAKLNVRGGEAKGYALAQNEPNPFKSETVVRFSVPEASQVSFRVYDVTGKVLMNRFINAAKGDNAITLRKSDINASGIVYYQIESGDFTATKKMVIIE